MQQLAYPAVPAGETLTAVAASTAPSWGAAGGATITSQKISPTNNQTTTSTSLTNLTAGSATLPTRTGGKAFMAYSQCIEKLQLAIGAKHFIIMVLLKKVSNSLPFQLLKMLAVLLPLLMILTGVQFNFNG